MSAETPRTPETAPLKNIKERAKEALSPVEKLQKEIWEISGKKDGLMTKRAEIASEWRKDDTLFDDAAAIVGYKDAERIKADRDLAALQSDARKIAEGIPALYKQLQRFDSVDYAQDTLIRSQIKELEVQLDNLINLPLEFAERGTQRPLNSKGDLSTYDDHEDTPYDGAVDKYANDPALLHKANSRQIRPWDYVIPIVDEAYARGLDAYRDPVFIPRD